MAFTEKELPLRLTKLGQQLLLGINEDILKQSQASLIDLNKAISKNERERLIQTYESTVKVIFRNWLRKVQNDIVKHLPNDKLKILLYLCKELSVQIHHSENFPYSTKEQGGVLSKSIILIQNHFVEKMRDVIDTLRVKAGKIVLQKEENKGSRKIVWLGNKQHLENLLNNLITKRCIKGQKNKTELTNIFLSHFKNKDQTPFATISKTKQLQLDLANGKIIGGILRELIYKGWIYQHSHSHTKERIAEVASEIFSGTTQKTIKNGMSMWFLNDANNPMSEVENSADCLIDSMPFEKLRSFDRSSKFKQVDSKF